MKNKNQIIFDVLDMMETIWQGFAKCLDADTIYRKAFAMSKCGDASLENDTREKLVNLLKRAKMPFEEKAIYHLSHAGDIPEFFDRAQLRIDCLNDRDLIRLFGLLCRTVTFTERGDLILCKYSPVVHETGWNRFALVCRGKVINKAERKIVLYPFDKFFNLNEVEETAEAKVRESLSTAKSVYVSEKMDGTMIAVAMHNGELLVTTPGSFDNEYTRTARWLLRVDHPSLLSNFPDKTLIFELICPLSKQCVEYGDEEKLVLIGARDINTNLLVPRKELEEIAAEYGLELTPQSEASLDELICLTGKKWENKEGWVIRITQKDNTELMFKLKYEEYFKIHALQSGINPKILYNRYVFGEIDLSCLKPGIADSVSSFIEEIEIRKREIKDCAAEMAKTILEMAGAGATQREIFALKTRFDKADDGMFHLAVRVTKGEDLDKTLNMLPYEKFRALVSTVERKKE